MTTLQYLIWLSLLFLTISVYSQNDFVKTTLTSPLKGIQPTYIGTDNGKTWFYYTESVKAKSIKLASIDSNLQINSTFDYTSTHMNTPGYFSYELVGNKFYGFYSTLKYPKYCLANLELETFDLVTKSVSGVPFTSFKDADAVGCDLIFIQSVSSPDKKRTALIQSGSKNELLIWVFDENYKQVLHKTIQLKGTIENFDPVFLNWRLSDKNGFKISDKGDIYFCYQYYDKKGANWSVAHINSEGDASFAKVPLAEGKYRVNFTIDEQYNPTVFFTKSNKGDLMDGYGALMFDRNLNITSQFNLNITDDIVNEVKQYGPSHKGIVNLAPQNIFKRADGSVVLIAEQVSVYSNPSSNAPAETTNNSIVVFFLDNQLNQTSSFVINKRQVSGAGSTFNSFAACLKGDNIYLFYNSDFVKENLPKLDFMMRVITPNNKITDAVVLKNKDNDEKNLQNVIPAFYSITNNEIVFITSGSNSYGSGNTENFSFFDVKFSH